MVVVVVAPTVIILVTALVVVVVLMLPQYCLYLQGQAILLWLVLAVLLARVPRELLLHLVPLWWLLLQALVGLPPIVNNLVQVVQLPLQRVPLDLLVV